MRHAWLGVLLAGCPSVDTGADTDTDRFADTDTTPDTDADTDTDTDTDRDTDTDPATDVDTDTSFVPPPVAHGVNDALDPNDTADPLVAGARTVSAGGRLWRRTFADEFEGPQPGDDPSCFTRRARCVIGMGWGTADCPAVYDANLADLNKCTWTVLSSFNWMSEEGDDGYINGFSPAEVTVSGGQLRLTAHGHGLSGTDCGREFTDPAIGGYGNRSNECAITSGAVQSRGDGVVPGFDQTHGRIEIRGTLSHGPGSWPAYWMMPTAGPLNLWPDDGEIDIMEAWANSDERVAANYHDGDTLRDIHVSKGQKWTAKRRYYPQADRRDTFFSTPHVYAVEWEPDELRFYVDKWLIGVFREGQEIDGFAIEIPDYPFYLILNLTIAPKLGTWLEDIFFDYRPDPDDFDPQVLTVDYVRAYAACDPADACPEGTFDGANCYVASAPAGTDPWVDDRGRLLTAAVGGACPSGGRLDGRVCVHASADPANDPFLWAGNLYVAPACVEATLSPRSCTTPCAGVGDPDGYGCFLGVAPNDLVADVDDQGFFYRRTWVGGLFSPPDCAPGDAYDPSRGCAWGDVPAGRTPFVLNDDGVGRFYVEPLCEVEHDVAACARPCPSGGEFDGVGCRIGAPPAGTTPFVYDNRLYYAALTSDPTTACLRGGSWDGANCLLGEPPAGTTAWVAEGRFYVDAACGRVPWWDTSGR